MTAMSGKLIYSASGNWNKSGFPTQIESQYLHTALYTFSSRRARENMMQKLINVHAE